MKALADRHNVPFSDNLTIVSMDTNELVLSYTGDEHGLSVGSVVVNHDPAHLFYRRILSIADDPKDHLVTVETVHVLLTDIVRDGSFSPEVFIPSKGEGRTPLWVTNLSYGIFFTNETV